jgi:capsular polysaccharide biosynthesis protein
MAINHGSEDGPPSLRHYARAVRRQAWLVVVVLIAVAVSAGILVARQDPVYRASMKIVVGQGGGVFRPDAGGSVDSFTQTMTNLLESNVVADRVIADAGLRTSADELLENVAVSTRPQSAVLTVTYDSTDKDEAVDVLNRLGSAFRDLVPQSLRRAAAPETREDGSPGEVTASVFDPAHVDADPVSPRAARSLLIAGMLGLVVGVILVVARETLDTRVIGVNETEDAFDAPVIGALPSRLRSRAPPQPEAGQRAAP